MNPLQINKGDLVLKMHCVEEYSSLYIPEERHNEVSDEGADIADLLHSNSCLRTLYTDMQKAVEMADDNNVLLRTENNELKIQNKSSRQSIQNLQLLVNELEDIRVAKAEKEQICGEIEASCKELAKENETLRKQVDELSGEASSFLLERQQQDKEITNLSCVLRALQQQLEEHRLDLEHKEELINQKDIIIEQLKDSVSEYITINQDMKEKLKDLEDHLALALVRGEGNFMNVDTDTTLSPEHLVSLGEELGIGFAVQMIPEQEQKEEEKSTETLEEQATLYVSESMTHSRTGNIKRGACAAAALCFGVLGVFGALTPTLSADVLDTIRHLIEPYCRIRHTGLPPV